MAREIHEILQQYWGYKTFRPLQQEIIQSVLDGKDTLALLPTGGGKSICFQVPAMLKDGLCLVITPLIALMKDQVDQLKRRGIPAIAVTSGMDYREIELAFDNCMFGNIKFLYLSPERLETEKFRVVLPRLKVNLIAVDESHCISQWGYDFRPPYLRIAAIREHLPGIPVLALTATATAQVVKDIQEKLLFKQENVFRKTFVRENLTYVVQNEENKPARLLRICQRIGGTGIVYVRNRKKTREIAEFLNKHNVSADFYHAGLETEIRDRKQHEWMTGKTRVIVSTNAFGMGIDKPDVRFVVHLDLPDSLEAYFQEAGRAGRDLKPSWAVILYNEGDILDLRHQLEQAYPPVDFIKMVYHQLGNYFQLATGSGKDIGYDFELSEFCAQFKLKPVLVYNALKFLEKEGYLMLSEEIGSPSLVHFNVDKATLYRYQVANIHYDPFIKLLLRSYTGLFSQYTKISESELARRSGLTPEQVIEWLRTFDNDGIISYIPVKKKPQIIYLRERIDAALLDITPANYNDRLRIATSNAGSVIAYVTGNVRCRSQQLIEYFGDTNTSRCGKCDVCISLNKLEMSQLEFEAIQERVLKLLQSTPSSIDDLLEKLAELKPDKVLKVIQWMLDNGLIGHSPDQKLKLNK